MNRKQVTKQVYLVPRTEVVPVKIESPILANSPVNGGHNDAGDDEELNAKQFQLDDEDGLWQDSRNLWEE